MRAAVVLLAVVTVLLSVSHVAGIQDYEKFVASTITDNPIVIFSKSYCPYCKRAKQAFARLKVKPFVIELDHQDDGAEIQAAVSELVGRRTVPQVFIKGVHLGGSDDTMEALASGRLAQLVSEASKQEL